MFGIVKKLLGKKSASSTAQSASDAGKGARKAQPAAAESPSGTTASHPAASTGGGTGFVAKGRGPGAAGSKASAVSASEKINVSLLGIVSLLPQELQPARAVGDFASVHLSFPLRPILEQLGHGCVRVPLGQVRKLAPEGFFTAGPEHDQKLVELPLQEVLQQVDLRSFTRRKDQKTVSVPDDVTSVFSIRPNPSGAPGRGGSSKPAGSGGTTQFVRKTPAAPPAPPASATPPAMPVPPVAGSGTGFVARKSPPPPASSSPVSPANRAEVAGSAPRPQPPAPSAAPAAPAAPVARQGAVPSAEEAPAPVIEPPPPVSKPISAPNIPQFSSTAAAWKSAASSGRPTSTPAPAPAAAPTQAAPAGPAAAPAGAGVHIPLSNLSQSWPEDVRAEIAAWHLGNAVLVLPTSDVAAALKQGRVQYPWSRVLALLQDALGAGRVSTYAETLLELPLAVVAPAFLAQCRPGGAGSAKVPVDQTIPDLFHSTTAPAAAPAAEPVSVGGRPAVGRTTAGTPAVPVAARSAVAPMVPAPQGAEVQGTPAPVAPAGGVLTMPLPMVNELWSDALKADIARTQVPGLKIEIPFEELDRSLKSGKIEYTWGRIRAWITPPLAEDIGAEHDDRLLTLPLKVIAPVFLQQLRPARAQRKADVAGDIPDLFNGGAAQAQGAVIDDAPPAPAAPAAAPAAPGAAGAEAAAPSSPANPTNSTTQFWRKPPEDLGELFGQPGKRNWTPTEIVQNTLRIKGVSGAVIAMQDGLLVAAQLPSPWKPEATAAFIPQIYARLTQYLKELSAGDLSSVTLSTASGTLLVFNAGIIYFGVLTKNDERLPLSLVRLIVTELSRHAR